MSHLRPGTLDGVDAKTAATWEVAYQRGYEAGEQAQLRRDAETVCQMCAEPQRYTPAARQSGYDWHAHTEMKYGNTHRCSFYLGWSAWAERAATEGQAKT